MKPEEIKKGLECCNHEYVDCHNCPYNEEGEGWACVVERNADALDYIQQLEIREWDSFDLLSSAWYGKGCYFKQEDGTVYSRVSGECMTFDQAIDEFAHELTWEREAEQPKWISVEERLPENCVEVLIYYKKGYASMGYWDDDLCEWDGMTDEKIVRPEYWMSLPEPPKE